MNKSLIVAILVSLTVGIGIGYVFFHRMYISDNKLNERLNQAIDFLLMQYNSHLELCCVSPIYFPSTYYLVSDNLWAHKALEGHHSNISNAIKEKLLELAELYNLPTTDDGLPRSYKHEAISGYTVPISFRSSNKYVLNKTCAYTIFTETCNGTMMTDWQEYADLLLFTSLSCHYEGNETGAIAHFNTAKSMWDGKGLNDTVTKETGTYATYKLGLLLYVTKILNQQLPFKSKLTSNLWSMQRKSDGGIVTHYTYSNNSIVPIGDANTETTSLTVIAYMYSP